MCTKNIFYDLRTARGLSQDELAEKVYVTRQAVSRWERGDTVPSTDTLKLLSALFGVSIDELLGAPRQKTCRCCGMILDDSTASLEPDGTPNTDYCRWCYREGEFTLDIWQRYAELDGGEGVEQFKRQIMEEFNALHIDGLPKVEQLNVLTGSYINLEYTLPNGSKARLLDDRCSYLGDQLPCEFGGGRCFGIAANMQFLLVCTYEENGANPELILYKAR